MRVPPPPHTHTHTHTHTQTLDIHVRLSAPGFGAHRICGCADPDFHFFSSAYFTEGSICLGPLHTVVIPLRQFGSRHLFRC